MMKKITTYFHLTTAVMTLLFGISLAGLGRAATVQDVNVTLDITHTFDADVSATLISPLGTRVNLFNGIGSSDDNFSNTTLDDEAADSISSGFAPFTGSHIPFESLSGFDGESAEGEWILEVTDVVEQDEGTLNSWRLVLVSDTGTKLVSSTDVPKAILAESTITSSLTVSFVPVECPTNAPPDSCTNVLPTSVDCQILFCANYDLLACADGGGTSDDGPMGVYVVVSADPSNEQNLVNCSIEVPGIGSTILCSLAPGGISTNFIGSFECNSYEDRNFQAFVNCEGEITGDCFAIQSVSESSFGCFPSARTRVTKKVACLPPGLDCDSLSASDYTNTVVGFKVGQDNPSFCYMVTITNEGNVGVELNTINDTALGNLIGDFPATLDPAASFTKRYLRQHAANELSTVTVTCLADDGNGFLTNTYSTAAMVSRSLEASFSCNLSLNSADDLDGSANDGHVTFSGGPQPHSLLYQLQLTGGDVPLTITVDPPSVGFGACSWPQNFLLPANVITTLQCQVHYNCENQPTAIVTNTVTVTGSIQGTAGSCVVADTISECMAIIECLACPTCSIVGSTSVPANSAGNGYSASSSLSGSSFQWSLLGDGTIVGSTTTSNISVTAGASGSFDLTVLVVKDGCTNTCETSVSIIAPPVLGVSPASQSFGTITTGTTADRTFVVTNTGGSTLTGTATTVAPFSVLSGSPYTVAPDGSTNVVVRFSPATDGSFTTNVVFASNGGNSTNQVSGTGVSPTTTDLSGFWAKQVVAKCKKGACSLKGQFSVSGPAGLSNVLVRFYLSDDNVFGEGDQPVVEVPLAKPLKAGKSGKVKLKTSVAGDSVSGKFVIAVIDPNNEVIESNEGNNTEESGPLP